MSGAKVTLNSNVVCSVETCMSFVQDEKFFDTKGLNSYELTIGPYIRYATHYL